MSCCELSNEFRVFIYAFNLLLYRSCDAPFFFFIFSRLKMGILCRYRVKRKQIQRFTNETIRYVRPTDKAHQPTFFFFFRYETFYSLFSSIFILSYSSQFFFSLFHCLICSCTVFFLSLFSITCRKPNQSRLLLSLLFLFRFYFFIAVVVVIAVIVHDVCKVKRKIFFKILLSYIIIILIVNGVFRFVFQRHISYLQHLYVFVCVLSLRFLVGLARDYSSDRRARFMRILVNLGSVHAVASHHIKLNQTS